MTNIYPQITYQKFIENLNLNDIVTTQNIEETSITINITESGLADIIALSYNLKEEQYQIDIDDELLYYYPNTKTILIQVIKNIATNKSNLGGDTIIKLNRKRINNHNQIELYKIIDYIDNKTLQIYYL